MLAFNKFFLVLNKCTNNSIQRKDIKFINIYSSSLLRRGKRFTKRVILKIICMLLSKAVLSSWKINKHLTILKLWSTLSHIMKDPILEMLSLWAKGTRKLKDIILPSQHRNVSYLLFSLSFENRQ